MYFVRILFLFYLGVCDAADFNQAYAASVVANIEQLVTVPWTRVNNILFSAFNTRWSYLYTGDDVDPNLLGPDGFVQYVDTNNTIRYLWSIFKPFEYEGASSIDMIYFGFENGKFIGYTNPSPGKLVFLNYGNSSCSEFNITARCREFYGGNSTNPLTGQRADKFTNVKVYDPRWRPWYIGSLERGSIWTDPYIFTEYEVLGITASQPIITDSGHVIGVIGTDYTLGSIEIVLGNLVAGHEDIFIFIVDNLGNLIAASIKGIGVDVFDKQIPAINSSYSRISKITQIIEKDTSRGGLGGWVSANGTIITVEIDDEGLYWAQSREFRDPYGLHWHVVVVDAVYCEAGYFVLNKEQIFKDPDASERVVCGICPEGAECVGGNKLPFPKKNYWSNLDTSGVKMTTHRCVRKTCQGFSNAMHDCGIIQHNYDKMLEYCFTINSYKFKNHSYCDVNELICKKGSTGPLCGSCIDDWRYSSLTRTCIKCDANPILAYITLIIVLLLCLIIALLAYYRAYIEFPLFIWNSWIFMMSRHLFRTGNLKVVISTYQIIQAITYSMEISYPKLFSKSLRLLNFLAFDFPGLECSGVGVYDRIYFTSCSPIVLAIIIAIVGKIRVILVNIEYVELMEERDHVSESVGMDNSGGGGGPGGSDDQEKDDEETNKYLKKKDLLFFNKRINMIKSQHAWALLFLSYFVLPPIAGKQLKAFDCITISLKNYKNLYVLKSDTGVNCNHENHFTFQIVNGLFLFLYLSIPILWLILLQSKKNQLFPVGIKEDLIIIQRRKLEESLLELKFLYERYRPSMFFFETIDVFRRIIFIGLIPLLSSSSLIRSAIGVVVSLLFLIVNRELMPYVSIDTNVVNYIGDLVIYLVFASSLMIETGLNQGVDTVLFGIILVMVNCSVLGIGISGAFLRTKLDREEVFKQKSKNITKVEYACKYSSIQFQNIFEVINQNEIPPSHVLMFYYGSLNDIHHMLYSGIHVNKYRPGIIFTILHPGQLSLLEKRYFSNNIEAFIVCSLPQRLLTILPGEDDDITTHGKSISLWLLPNGVLRSMRGMYFDDLVDPHPWEEGKLLLPPQCIKRAFQIKEDISSLSSSNVHHFLLNNKNNNKKISCLSNPYEYILTKLKLKRRHKVSLSRVSPTVLTSFPTPPSSSSSMDTSSSSSTTLSDGDRRYIESMEDANNESLPPSNPVSFPLKFTVISDFLASMIEIHKYCKELNLIPIYHYTDVHSAELIAKAGMKMNHKTDIGNAGVHFTVLGPISYNLGSLNYETNIISDFYGDSNENIYYYSGHNRFEVCLVYGVDPYILEMTASGKGNLVHIPQKYFTDLSMPHPNGKYFLHPHRLIGAFRFDARGKFSGLSKYRDDLKLQHFQSLEILNKVHVILDEKDRIVTLIKTIMDEIAPSMKVTWAVTYSADKFQTIFNQLELNSIPSTHVLVYHYGSLSEIEKYVTYGIPIKRKVGNGNIIFSMHQPDALTIEEVKIFGGSCEAFIVCSLPRDALLPLNTGRSRSASLSDGNNNSSSSSSSRSSSGSSRYGKSDKKNKKQKKRKSASSASTSSTGTRRSISSDQVNNIYDSKLFYLPSSILRAMRSKYYKNVPNPEPWEKGALILPPHCFQQAFQITDDEHIVKKSSPTITRSKYVFDREDGNIGDGGNENNNTSLTSNTTNTPAPRSPIPSPLNSLSRPTPTSNVSSITKISLYYQYITMMEKHQSYCKKHGSGLKLVYYYTNVEEATSIIKNGFLMKNGQFGMFSTSSSTPSNNVFNNGASGGSNSSHSSSNMIIGGGVRFSLKEPLSFGLWSKIPITHSTNPPFLSSFFGNGTNNNDNNGNNDDIYNSSRKITYEENVINGFLGENNMELTQEATKHKVNVCIIYAVNSSILYPVAGMSNLVNISKEYFQEFGLPSREGRYYLRPDYIMGAYTFHDRIPHDMADDVNLHRVFSSRKSSKMFNDIEIKQEDSEDDVMDDISRAAAAVAAKSKSKDSSRTLETDSNTSTQAESIQSNHIENDDHWLELRITRLSTDSDISSGRLSRVSSGRKSGGSSARSSETSDPPSSSRRTSDDSSINMFQLESNESIDEGGGGGGGDRQSQQRTQPPFSSSSTSVFEHTTQSTSSSSSFSKSSSPRASPPRSSQEPLQPLSLKKKASLEELTQDLGSFEIFDKDL